MKDKLVPATVSLFESLEKIKNHRLYVIYAQISSIQVVACDDEETARKLADSRSGVIIHGEVMDYIKPVTKKEKTKHTTSNMGRIVYSDGVSKELTEEKKDDSKGTTGTNSDNSLP